VGRELCVALPATYTFRSNDNYHGSRTHLALGKVIALPMVGGLHHRYTRRAA